MAYWGVLLLDFYFLCLYVLLTLTHLVPTWPMALVTLPLRNRLYISLSLLWTMPLQEQGLCFIFLCLNPALRSAWNSGHIWRSPAGE